jgi:hypothetical protein
MSHSRKKKLDKDEDFRGFSRSRQKVSSFGEQLAQYEDEVLRFQDENETYESRMKVKELLKGD